MTTDEFNLARFVSAQQNSYTIALAELRLGKKRSHWIWYVFPQLRGLGQSTNSEFYGLTGLAEARAYLAHPVLGERLIEATRALMAQTYDAASVLGQLDALKFKSCLTLFLHADPSMFIFADALDRFFKGERDARTLELLQ